MKHYKSFVKDIGLIGSASLLDNLKSLLIIPILTKLIGLADYGIWVQIKISLSLLAPFVTMGMGNSIVRYLSGETDAEKIRRELSSIAVFTMFIGGILCAVLCIFSDFIARYVLHSTSYAFLVKLFAFLLVLESFNLLLVNYFRSSKQIKTYVIILFFEICTEFSAIAVAVFLKFGITGAIISLLMVRGIFITIKLVRVFKKAGIALPKFDNLRRNIAFGLPLLLSSSMFFIVNSGDRYVINYFLGLKDVGIYSLAYSLAYIIVLVTAPIGYILYPTITASCNNDRYREAETYVEYSHKYFIAIGVPLCFFISFFAREIIILVSTKEFLTAVNSVPVLLFSLLVFQIGVIGEYINMVFDRTRFILFLHSALAVMNIVLNILFIPYFGIMGAAVATLITFIIFSAANIMLSRKYLRFKMIPKMVFKAFVASSIAVLFLKVFNVSILLKVFAGIPVSVVLYVGTIYLFRGFNKKELLFIRDMFL